MINLAKNADISTLEGGEITVYQIMKDGVWGDRALQGTLRPKS